MSDTIDVRVSFLLSTLTPSSSSPVQQRPSSPASWSGWYFASVRCGSNEMVTEGCGCRLLIAWRQSRHHLIPMPTTSSSLVGAWLHSMPPRRRSFPLKMTGGNSQIFFIIALPQFRRRAKIVRHSRGRMLVGTDESTGRSPSLRRSTVGSAW